VQNVLMCPAEQ